MSFLAILKGITTAAQVGMTIYSGIKQNQETDRINAANNEIAQRNYEDEKSQRIFSNNLATMASANARRSLDFQEEEADRNRAERAEERGYNRMQNAANRFSDYLNSKVNIQSNTLSPILSRGR